MPTHHLDLRRQCARLVLVLAFALALAACEPGPATTPGANGGPTDTPPAVITSAPATAVVGVVTSPPTLAPAAEPTSGPLELYDWDDGTVFEANLTPAERPVLAALPGASVYQLAVTIDSSLTQVRGRQAVRYTNQEDSALNEIVFRLFPNLLGGAVGVSALTVDGSEVTAKLDQRDTVLRVPLAVPLQPGSQVIIALDLDVTVPQELERNYGVLAAAQGVLALAHFFPYVAVYDDEGWNDEIAPTQGDVTYGDASFFIVQVKAPAELVLAGAGTVISEQSGAGQQTVTYALGPARDFYLAASSAYKVTSGQAGATTVRVYAPEGHGEAAQQTVADASRALRVFAARFGPYPYSELDLVATPTYALGIEYPGVIALTNDLFDPAERRLLEAVTAHEVGHQWFYNLVGSDQLDDPWLDESLTQYATMQYFADTAGAEAAASYRDSLTGRWSQVNFAEIPIGRPVASYDGPEYSAIVYGRGPLFFETLAETMGTAIFDAFVSDYAQTYRWGIATPAGLRARAEAACRCGLGELFEAWVGE